MQRVLPEIVQPVDSAVITALFFEKRNVTEFPARRLMRCLERHPGLDVFHDQLFQMECELLLQFRVSAILSPQRPEPLAQDPC
jgi:hypothetical protein